MSRWLAIVLVALAVLVAFMCGVVVGLTTFSWRRIARLTHERGDFSEEDSGH